MTFETLGNIASTILADVSPERVGARKGGLKIRDRVENSAGEIERVAWLRKTDQGRKVDASLLTENRELYGVRGEGEERERQARLLERVRRHRPR